MSKPRSRDGIAEKVTLEGKQELVRHKDTDDVTDFLMVDSAEYSRLSYSTWGRPPTHIAAGASACGYVLQKALEAAFTTCNIGATEGNASALLFGDRDGKPLIDCQDGKNFGKQRVIDALTDTYMDTFFGKIVFSPIRQNFGGHMVILQFPLREEVLSMCFNEFRVFQEMEFFTPSPFPVQMSARGRLKRCICLKGASTHASALRVRVPGLRLSGMSCSDVANL
eukprot:1138964-Pelagomonas_calceolata.AAC.5